jgi:two-component system OmpR family sensor kinase
MKAPFGALPIFVQLLALAIFSMAAAHLINLAVVLTLPDPPPEGFTVAEAARALTGETVITGAGKRLQARLQAEPPAIEAAAHADPMAPVLAQALAQTLGVGSDRVRVALDADVFQLRHSVEVRHTIDHVSGDRRETGQVLVTMGASERGPEPIPMHMAGESMAILAQHAVFPSFTAAWKRPDGRWSVVEPSRPWLSPWQLRLIVSFLISAVFLTLIAWLAARRLARPIHLFASAAERLGGDPHAPPLAAQGPAEVRTAVAAFNDMQDKLRRYVNDRTLMIASIAHDLRTPLTRLRFRIDGAPADLRAKTIADIEQMDAMIGSALAYARGETATAERVRLDLGALAGAIADDMVDTGAEVTFASATPVLVMGDSIGLKRMLANLLDNAVKFGGRARMALTRDGDWALLTIDDDGLGLPPEELERAFDPFYRPDAARTAGAGGFGLGLAAARSVARAHGGEVTLSNRSEGGLRATARLPASA